MDNSVFEILFKDTNLEKIDTLKCLTDYYKKIGHNIFKSAELAENNILNFIEFVNNCNKVATEQNIPYLFSSACKEVVIFNKEYFYVKDIYFKLLEIGWRNFEIISGDILETCFGAIEVKVTQKTADGGLDFEGKLPIKAIVSKKTYGYIEVYGQSKKYSENVGIYDIKSFVAFANTKKRGYVHQPQLFVFFTTSDYAQNAIKEIKETGFVGLSGFQLSTLIYHHRNSLIEKNDLFKQILNLN